jgi:hypothetical protein
MQLDIGVMSLTQTLSNQFILPSHSVIKHGIIFLGNSSNSKKIFALQKKIVRLIAGVKPRISCKSLFKRLEIVTLPCEYICSLMNLIVNNHEHFQTNFTINSVNTRNKNQLHRSIANLSRFQKSTYYASIIIFNNLPSSLTSLVN